MRRNLSGWRVLVTGASSGIGRAVAVELLRHGARLVVVARRRDRLETIAPIDSGRENGRCASDFRSSSGDDNIAIVAGDRNVRLRPGASAPIDSARENGRCASDFRSSSGDDNIAIIAGDITDPAVRSAALAAAGEHFGGLDAIVSCAGVGARGAFVDSDPAVLRRLFEVDFFAPVELWRESLPMLRVGRMPLIVSVDSILGYWGIPNMSGYCAAKSALRGAAESLRGELNALGVGLLTVTPGSTATEFHDQALDRRSRPVTAGRLAVTPEYVARRIVRAMQRGEQRLIPGFVARLAMTLARLFPTTFRRAATRAALRRRDDSTPRPE